MDRDGPRRGRSAAGSDRQTLIDLEFLPLLDPEEAVGVTALDREYDVGDLGAVETGTEDDLRPEPAPAAGSASRARGETGRKPESRPDPGRRPPSPPRGPGANGSRAGSSAGAPVPPGESPELLIVLTIVSPDNRELAGPVIRDALAAFSLQPDEQGNVPSLREPPGLDARSRCSAWPTCWSRVHSTSRRWTR